MGNFRTWLESSTDSLESYVLKDGNIAVYHFASHNGKQPNETLTTDPAKFGANSFTKNDLKHSDIPRTFFYIDLSDKEGFFQNKPLYKGFVPYNRVYNLLKDPLGFKNEIIKQNKNNNILNISLLLDMVKSKFDGIYYNPGIQIVSWFKPLQLRLVNNTESQLNVPMDDGSSFSGTPRQSSRSDF